MISYSEHQKNQDHFYSLGTQAFAIFKAAGALELWRNQDYFLEDISGDDKTETVSFKYKCYSQGDNDEVYITMSYALVDNFLEPLVIAAAHKQKAANEQAKIDKAAAAAEQKAATERVELAHTFIKQAKRLSEMSPGNPTTALELAAPLKDESLNSIITSLDAGLDAMTRKAIRDHNA